MDLIAIFITGLTVGGITCMAVQGGLLASVIASGEKENIGAKSIKYSIVATVSFLISKLIAYTILGILLGFLGSAISLTSNIQSVMQIFAGIYMIIIALNLLDVHPIFRYAIITPPRFLTRIIKNKSRSSSMFAPSILGFLTIFIPCGTTLAMEALAISSANPLKGGLILFTFVIGTVPLFLGLGVFIAKLGEVFRVKFLLFASFFLIFLGSLSIYGGLIANGVSIPNLSFKSLNSSNEKVSFAYPPFKNGFQIVLINVDSYGYRPARIILKENIPTKLTLKTKDTYSCAIAFRIPSFKIAINLKPTGEEVITLPKLPKGEYLYTCSMGMYQGVFEVK